jgi:hypothetical protein
MAMSKIPPRSLPRMAFDTLKHRNIAQIYWMFEWLVGPMARFALSIGQATKVDRVLHGYSL